MCIGAPSSWQGTCGDASLRKAARCGNVTADHAGVAVCDAECPMSHCSVTVLLQPSHGVQEAVFNGAQMV